MDGGTRQVDAGSRHSAVRQGLAAVGLWFLLFALAGAATVGAYLLRAHAAAACDMLERMGGLVLMFGAVVLFGVNVVLGTALWALLHRHAGLGLAGALVLGPLLFVVTGMVFLALTGVPEGYPTPPDACPRGEPPWWPDVLPG